MSVPRLELRAIRKQYPAVLANDDIDLAVAPGEIHAVLGENGAGKSTLMKIIYGVVRPDAGQILWDGEAVRITDPQAARRLGIRMVFQHFALFDTLTVAENVSLGLDERLSRAELLVRMGEIGERFGLPLEADRPVHSLSVGERQRVEIVRTLLGTPKLLILDEPTSVLTPQAVERLFETLRKLASEGCSILYISHKLDEIRALCTACTVLRGGRVSGRVDPRTTSEAELSRLMLGAEPPELPPRPQAAGEVLLELKELSLPAPDAFATPLERISLEVRAGEVLGIAGVSGNGQQELLATLSGEDARVPAAAIELEGQPIGALDPRARRHRGLHVIPEERLGRATVPVHSLAQNTLLTRTEGIVPSRFGWLSPKRLGFLAERLIQGYGVKAPGAQVAATSLSGGNLQKYIVGRELDAKPRVLVVAQPTWGVDVGAAARIRGEILQLAERGAAVLVISEELDELFELCDRLQVLARGRLSPAIPVSAANPERLGVWMSGRWLSEQEASHAAA